MNDMSVTDLHKNYIAGEWVGGDGVPNINPSNTNDVVGEYARADRAQTETAIAAAKAAFPAWSATSREARLAVLRAIAGEYRNRADDLAAAVTEEMGAPAGLSRKAQVGSGLAQLNAAIDILETYPFEEDRGPTRIVREPIGVCALITPWNWPLNQIACKIAPALAVGCTMVLKPSEIAPFSAYVLAEILDAAGVPAGVFNLVNGDGPTVGARLSGHRDVDMVSFTGSTRAGVEVARAAAPTVKRVCQELGGKSAHIILDDDAFAKSVTAGTRSVMVNSGQSCNAPTRLLVPRARMAEARLATRRNFIQTADSAIMAVSIIGEELAFGPLEARAGQMIAPAEHGFVGSRASDPVRPARQRNEGAGCVACSIDFDRAVFDGVSPWNGDRCRQRGLARSNLLSRDVRHSPMRNVVVPQGSLVGRQKMIVLFGRREHVLQGEAVDDQ